MELRGYFLFIAGTSFKSQVKIIHSSLVYLEELKRESLE